MGQDNIETAVMWTYLDDYYQSFQPVSILRYEKGDWSRRIMPLFSATILRSRCLEADCRMTASAPYEWTLSRQAKTGAWGRFQTPNASK